MTFIPPFSPGCFGSALAFKEGDVACSGCKFAQACKPVHLVAQAALRERFGVTTAIQANAEKVKAKDEAAPVNPAALSLPKKTQELVARLDRGQYDVVGSLQRGENPFGSAIPFMKLACHLLLRLAQPLSAKGLATAYATKFEWQQGTADAHARMAIQALTHVGAVENRDGLISIRKG
ncbi:hypothetical protein [Agrobacterium sp. CG674]